MKINAREIYEIIMNNKDFASAYAYVDTFQQVMDILMEKADVSNYEFVNHSILAIHNLIAIVTLYNNIISKNPEMCDTINKELLDICPTKMIECLEEICPEFIKKYINKDSISHDNKEKTECDLTTNITNLGQSTQEEQTDYNITIGSTNLNQLTQEQIDMCKEKNWSVPDGMGDYENEDDFFE